VIIDVRDHMRVPLVCNYDFLQSVRVALVRIKRGLLRKGEGGVEKGGWWSEDLPVRAFIIAWPLMRDWWRTQARVAFI